MTAFLLSTVAFSVVSQSLMDASIILLLIALCIQHFKAKNTAHISLRKLRKPYLFEIGFILYILSICIGFLYYKIDLGSAASSLIKFSWIINFYIFYWYFTTNKPNFETLALFFSLAFLIPNIYAISTFLYNYDFIRHTQLKDHRVIGLLNSATYHAHANALIFAFFSSYTFFKFNELSKKLKIAYLLSSLLMGLSIFFTMTRGPILSLFLVFMFFIFKQSKKMFFYIFTICLISFGILYTQTDLIKNRVAQTVDKSQIDNIRVNLFKVHIEMIKTSPFIGIGYTAPLNHTHGWWHTLNLPEDYYDSHAHNQLLNVWATTGVIGLISFCLFYFWFFIKNIQLVRLFRHQKNLELYYIAVACLVTQSEYIIANFTDIGFEYSKIRTLILIVWALVLALWTKQKDLSYDNK